MLARSPPAADVDAAAASISYSVLSYSVLRYLCGPTLTAPPMNSQTNMKDRCTTLSLSLSVECAVLQCFYKSNTPLKMHRHTQQADAMRGNVQCLYAQCDSKNTHRATNQTVLKAYNKALNKRPFSTLLKVSRKFPSNTQSVTKKSKGQNNINTAEPL